MNNNLYNSDGLYRGLFSQKPDPKPLTKQSMKEPPRTFNENGDEGP